MIKVIHVLSDMKIGGAGRWLLNLLGATDQEKFEIKVVLPQGSLLIDEITALGFEVIPIDGMKDKSFDTGAVSSLLEIFKREKPQIVHTHASLSARLAAKIAGAKIINTKHCIDSRKTGVKKLASGCLNNLLSDRIVAVSSAVKKNLIDNGFNEDKISVIYGGISPVKELSSEEKSSIRRKWGITDENTVVGIVARLAEVKGHKHFIDAADIISRDNADVKFLITGIGPKEQELKELVSQRELEDRVIFTGFADKVSEIFNIIDINVISSLSEALCLSLIEGMCVGKPCVGTNTGGIPEVIKDGYNGYLVPVADPLLMAEAINKLVQNPELRNSMGEKGKELVQKYFTADAMARDIGKLYEVIVNSPDNGR